MAWSSDLNTSNQYIKYEIGIMQNFQSIVNNTSNVTVKVWVYRTNTGYTTSGSGTVYCTINGTTYSSSIISSQKITHSGIYVFEKTLDIPHDANGKKTLVVSAYIKHSQFSSSSQSFSQVLTDIPRASSFNNVTGKTIGSDCTVTITRKVSSFTHQLWYKVGNSDWYDLGKNIGTSKTFTINMATCSQITSATTGTMQLCLRTYSGDTKIGNDVYKDVNVSVPDSVKPTCEISVSDVKGYASTYGGYIQGQSKLSVSVNGTGKYGSTIKSYYTKVNGGTYPLKEFVTDEIAGNGEISIVSAVTDSRGRSGSVTKKITVIPYTPPQITKLAVHRCNEDGTDNVLGSYCRATFSFEITSLDGKNTHVATILYRKNSESEYTSIALDTGTSVVDMEKVFPADDGSTYEVLIRVEDSFSKSSRSTVLSTAQCIFHIPVSGKGITFGGVAETDGFVVKSMDAMFEEIKFLEYATKPFLVQKKAAQVTVNANSSTSQTVVFNVPDGYRFVTILATETQGAVQLSYASDQQESLYGKTGNVSVALWTRNLMSSQRTYTIWAMALFALDTWVDMT